VGTTKIIVHHSLPYYSMSYESSMLAVNLLLVPVFYSIITLGLKSMHRGFKEGSATVRSRGSKRSLAASLHGSAVVVRK